MAEPIVQKLGFETSKAVQNIIAMGDALKGLNREITRFDKITATASGGKLGDAFDETAKKAKRATGAADKAFTGMEKGGKKAANAIQKVSFAWSGLAKALVARTAVQAITKLTGAIVESANAAAEFEIIVARISNIAKGPGSGIAELTESLSNLSVELGRPITEVTEAAFEGLQNDLGNTAETMDFLAGAANDLALVTGGTLAQSVNSLSSVIKAYNLPISEAAQISDQFFAAIDKGRISLEELESSLGKITPLAAKLDIGFDQVAGAMAAITQSGTSASVANTQLRSIFQKLLKPTEDLQKAFDKLGADSFNQLIQRSGGLRQALQLIAEALGNDDRAIAKAFGRLRAQLGVFNLLSNEGKIFAETMDAVANSSGKAAAGAERIRGTEAFKAREAWEAYNETIRDTGKLVLKAQTALIKFFNTVVPDAKTLVKIFERVTVVAIAIGGPLVITSLAGLATALWSVAAASAAAMAPLIAGAAIGIALGEMYKAVVGDFTGAMEKIDETAKDKLEAIAEASKKALEAANQDIENLLKQRGQVVDDYIEGMEAAFDRETAALRQSVRIIGDALSTTISDFESGMNSMIDGMKGKLKGLNKNLAKANVDAKSAKQELEDFRFDRRQQGQSEFQKIDNLIGRANTSARDMGKSMREALSNPDAAAQAEADIERVLKLADQLIAKSEAIRNPVKAREAREAGESLKERALEAAVKGEEAKVNAIERQTTATEGLLNIQKSITTEIAEQLRLRRELVSVLDKSGQLKSPEQQASDKERLGQIDANISRLLGSLSAGLFRAFGEKKHADKLIANVIEGFKKAEFDFSQVSAGVQKVLDQTEFQALVKMTLDLQTTGDEKIDEVVQAAITEAGINPAKRAETARKAYADALKEMTTAENAYAAAINRAGVAMEEADSRGKVALEHFADTNEAQGQAIMDTWNDIQKRILDPNVTKEKMALIENEVTALQGRIAVLLKEGLLADKFASAALEGLDAVEKQIAERTLAFDIAPRFDPKVMQSLRDQIQGVMASGEEGAQNTSTAVGLINTAMGTVIATTKTAISTMAALKAEAIATAKAVAAAQAGGNKYHGGKIAYRAAGGPIRGQDTQLTATSVDEYIMNARSSRQWFSQLQAMNAGQSPQYRDKGGSVTNEGDTNINVSITDGARLPEARQFARDLERELRFNTSKLY